VPCRLDLVVTSVATQLTKVAAATATEVSEKVLAQLVEPRWMPVPFLADGEAWSMSAI